VRRILGLALAVGLGGAVFGQAQSGELRVSMPVRARSESRPRALASIRVSVKLVVIPVTATNALGAPVAGLPASAFHVFEEGVEQSISYFAAEDAPASVGIVFDASGSMYNKMDEAREAVAQFLRASVPGDKFFLVAFSTQPRLVCDFTSGTDEIERRLPSIRPDGWTALFDAVYLAISKMRHTESPRKALLVLSDGGDNHSRYSREETINYIREADCTIYSVGLLGSWLSKDGTRLLANISEETGGRMFPVSRLSDLPDAVAKIGAMLRHQYLLGYTPMNRADDGRYRKVVVKAEPPPDFPPLRVTWRTGYYAPH
jgi:Ca-activated chloride channel family protein